MNANPLITVLMPAYNAEKYIADAISSVLDQTFTDFELLIVNDGSTDKTEEIVGSFADARIRLINKDHEGLAVALNKGIHLARSGYIARFDADDLCFPQRLQAQYDFMMDHPGYAIIGSDAEYMDKNGNYVFTHRSAAHSYEEILLLYKTHCPFIHSSVLFKKEVIKSADGYNELATLFEDHLLWSKLIAEHKACNLLQALLTVRLNPESITIDEKWHSKRFLEIKSKAIKTGELSKADGEELKAIVKSQELSNIKEGSYYALLAKKYLWNNYQPKKARTNLKKSLQYKPQDIKSYALIMLSFLPKIFIQKIYSWISIFK